MANEFRVKNGLIVNSGTVTLSTFTLPATLGDNGDVLRIPTGGGTTLEWASFASVSSSGVTAVNNFAENRLTTVGSTTSELDGEANLTFDGSALQVTGTLTVGVDDTGHDVKFFGATSGAYMLWDESQDDLILGGAARLGIGTTSPSSPLDVTGSIELSSNLHFNGAGGHYIKHEGGTASSDNFTFRFSDNEDVMIVRGDGRVGIGTTSPQSKLHISSGTSGDSVLILEADTDNNDETDQPFIVFEQDGGVQHSAIGSFSGGNTDNNALILSNSVDNSGVQAGMIFKTGTSAGYANATESMRIYPAGETQARKTKVKAVSSNTTLGDDDSGKTIYWTGGTLTLPATAESGQQFVIINNTNGSATPSLGTSNSIATNWTAHAAMADETARTYIAVAANTWIYIG